MSDNDLKQRSTPLEISSQEFRDMGYRLVDRIARHFEEISQRPVTPGESPVEVKRLLGGLREMPTGGAEASGLLEETAEKLFLHSLFNAHPRFWGYITAGPAPIGVLADFLAAAVNANVGAWTLSPMATEIEAQSIRWIADLIGFPSACCGVMVSGGNMANFVCFLAARRAKATWNIRESGLAADGAGRLLIYASTGTHTWIQKAADLFGHGTNAIRWIDTDREQRVNVDAMRRQIALDREAGGTPFLVVGTAGSVSTGTVDPLPELAALCREQDLWFHVDGAYGALAAKAPGAPPSLAAIADADSVAVDPHKWLYAPLEAGCALVRSPEHLRDAFSYHPPYYHFDPEVTNYVDFGPQNSRGFRALKVWLALQQAGREGYMKMIGDDIRLARRLYEQVSTYDELEALTHELSITTLRYKPVGPGATEDYLNRLNQKILARIETGGEAFVSNAVIGEKFALRACIVNFRTSLADIEALPELVVRIGREVHQECGRN